MRVDFLHEVHTDRWKFVVTLERFELDSATIEALMRIADRSPVAALKALLQLEAPEPSSVNPPMRTTPEPDL